MHDPCGVNVLETSQNLIDKILEMFHCQRLTRVNHTMQICSHQILSTRIFVIAFCIAITCSYLHDVDVVKFLSCDGRRYDIKNLKDLIHIEFSKQFSGIPANLYIFVSKFLH